MLCISSDGLMENLGFKNSVDTAVDLIYKDVKFFMYYQRFLAYGGFGWEGRGFIQGNYICFRG